LLTAIVIALIAAAASALTFLCLNNWQGDRYLCQDCQFNSPDLCLKPERGHAVECTAYLPEQQ
jgi:hypothetical protein